MENINLIRKIAWSFHYTTGIQFEELLSEATLAYLEAEQEFDEVAKTKKSTYAYFRMKNRLINFCKDEQKVKFMPGADLREGGTEQTPFFEIMDSLPQNCQQLADIVLKSKVDFLAMPPKDARGMIVEELREHGWSWSKIWDSMRDMKQNLNSIPENSIHY